MAEKIEIEIDADAKKAIKGINNMNKSLKKQEGFLKKLGRSYALVGAVLGGAVVAGFVKATRAAIDFEEAVSKFETTFKGVVKEATAVRDNLVKSFGLSTKAATELLSATGDLLSGFGFTGQASLDLSKQVNELAADLASFSNAQGGTKAVSEALTKALLGERESLKTYGIAILDADVQQRLFEKGQKSLTGTALRQAKAQATLELAMEQSKNAIGDFSRTQDSAANITRRVGAAFEDLAVSIGTKFIPAIKEAARFILSLGKTAEENALDKYQLKLRAAAEANIALKKAIKEGNPILIAQAKGAKLLADTGLTVETQRLVLANEKLKKSLDDSNFAEKSLLKNQKDKLEVIKLLESGEIKLDKVVRKRALGVGEIEKLNKADILTQQQLTQILEGLAKNEKDLAEIDDRRATQKKIDTALTLGQTKALREAIKAQEAEFKAKERGVTLTKAQEKAVGDFTSGVSEGAKERITAIQDEQARLLELEGLSAEQKVKIIQSAEERIREIRTKSFTDAIGQVSDLVDTASELFSQFFDLQVNLLEQEKEVFNSTKDEEIEKLQEQHRKGLISQKQLDDGIAKIDKERFEREEEINKKIAEEKKKAFIAEKAAKIAQIVINTATGISNVWSQWGAYPIVAGILTGIVATAGTVQTAIAAAQPVPAFATGGSMITTGPQAFVAGDNPGGRERVDVIPLETSNINSNNRSTTNHNNQQIHIVANDTVDARNQLMQNHGQDIYQEGAAAI